MVNYGNGKIYKVICSETGRVYVGSTTVTLSRRMTNHRALSNTAMTKDFIDGKIFLIEDYPCGRKEELLSRERFYIETMDCVNKIIPTRTKKEYRQEKHEQIVTQNKEKFNCECGATITRGNKSHHFKTKKHIKFLHSLQTSQPSDACLSPSVSVP